MGRVVPFSYPHPYFYIPEIFYLKLLSNLNNKKQLWIDFEVKMAEQSSYYQAGLIASEGVSPKDINSS
jgi:hypothetical protein